MEIFGEKLLLSRISVNDLDFICRLECDKNLWCFEEDVPSDEQVVREKYLHKINESDQTSSYDFIVSIATDKRKTPIGLAQVWSYIEYRKSWEIGYAILPEYGGKGYGSEAATLLLKFAFEHLHAHKVVGMCNSNNTRSSSLMEHIGMTKEAVFKEELFWQNQWTDQYYFSILEKEFFAN
ncbi:GNAT family N-acetyltransferase [Paenibacillus sp. MER TA 81-3]|uniref:GNAT family N-acetyltransferase n=1 Tax=Paenibacillus sp. MER TA 81-3 TaxID=2939573 RepID=UPI00203CCF3C|nr:GNAT family protein [Paenibacillus sp. MER TA 81-3]MCM3341780.1 GNAT family N-acetyltransferase [Paenibacillus sp. MER TA 81-3]